LLVAASAVQVRAQSEDEARAHAKAAFERGVEEYAGGRYEQALGDFQEAYRIRPHPLVNVNIANCYDKLGRPLQAVALFEHFLESDVGSPAQRQEVSAALERLRKQVGKILVRVSPDGAAVTIDQGEQRTAPILEAIPLEAGNHNLTVSLEGYRSAQRPLIVKGGTTLELTVTLEREGAPALAVVPSPEPASSPSELPAPAATPEAAAPPVVTFAEPEPAPPAQPAPESHHEIPTAAYVTGGAALVLAVTGTIAGVLALGANKDFKQYKAARFDPAATAMQHVTAYDKASDAANRARTLAVVSDVALVGAVAAAVVTIVLLASHDGGSEHASPSARLSPALSTHGAGLALQADVALLE
jgi:hypothetical protein